MTVDSKKAVPKDLIDSLLADYKKPEVFIGDSVVLFSASELR